MHATGNRQQGTLHRIATATLACAAVLGLAGCRQDMHDQPKFFPQRGTSFYTDGRSVRPQVTGTIARGQEDEGSYYRTGLVGGSEGDGLPIPLTPALIQRGQEQFNVYCTACHSRAGNGRGMIVMRGFFPASDLHTDRLRNAPLGHFFNVISNGFGAMPDYKGQVTVEDRWAIAAYIRALQLSQHATAVDAAGAKVHTIQEVEKEEGFAPGFVQDWALPETATQVQRALPSSTSPAAVSAPAATSQVNPNTAPLASALPDGAKATTATTAAKVEATAASAVTPHVSAGNAANGQKLYMANCAVCHQPTRQGMPPMIPSLVGVVARIGAARIHAQVANGSPTSKPPMPAFPQLSNANVNDIVSFLAASK